jgi:hypothetical protein
LTHEWPSLTHELPSLAVAFVIYQRLVAALGENAEIKAPAPLQSQSQSREDPGQAVRPRSGSLRGARKGRIDSIKSEHQP